MYGPEDDQGAAAKNRAKLTRSAAAASTSAFFVLTIHPFPCGLHFKMKKTFPRGVTIPTRTNKSRISLCCQHCRMGGSRVLDGFHVIINSCSKDEETRLSVPSRALSLRFRVSPINEKPGNLGFNLVRLLQGLSMDHEHEVLRPSLLTCWGGLSHKYEDAGAAGAEYERRATSVCCSCVGFVRTPIQLVKAIRNAIPLLLDLLLFAAVESCGGVRMWSMCNKLLLFDIVR